MIPDLARAAQEIADAIDRPIQLLAKLGVLEHPQRDPQTLARDLVWDLASREDAKRAVDAAALIMELRWPLAGEAVEPTPEWWSGDLGQLVARSLPPPDPSQTVSVLAAAGILGISRASVYSLIGARTVAPLARGRVRLADVLHLVRGAATTDR